MNIHTFDGHKTKIAIITTVLYAISGLLLGHIDANAAFLMLMSALGGYGIYSKVERSNLSEPVEQTGTEQVEQVG